MEPDHDDPPTPPEAVAPPSMNNEEQGAVQDNDIEMQVQDSEDLFETDVITDDLGNPESENETAPSKPKEKVERVTQLPLSRIKHIMKLDPEVALVNTEAAFLITKATELFINFISKEAYAFTLSKKKKTINQQDLNSAISSDGPLFFLQGCLEN